MSEKNSITLSLPETHNTVREIRVVCHILEYNSCPLSSKVNEICSKYYISQFSNRVNYSTKTVLFYMDLKKLYNVKSDQVY